MLTDSTALVIQRRMKRVMMTSSALVFRISGLRVTPDDVADHDLLRNQAELEEAIGHALLGRNDIVGDRPDRERGTVGGDGLDIQGNTGDGAERFRYLVAMRFGPFRRRSDHVDDLLQERAMIAGKVPVGEVE